MMVRRPSSAVPVGWLFPGSKFKYEMFMYVLDDGTSLEIYMCTFIIAKHDFRIMLCSVLPHIILPLALLSLEVHV